MLELSNDEPDTKSVAQDSGPSCVRLRVKVRPHRTTQFFRFTHIGNSNTNSNSR